MRIVALRFGFTASCTVLDKEAVPRSRVLADLRSARVSQSEGHDPLAWRGLVLSWFPEIHAMARTLNALVFKEDSLYSLGTGHVHDSETERMALPILPNVRPYYRAERGKGPTKFAVGAKVGQSADLEMSTHSSAPLRMNVVIAGRTILREGGSGNGLMRGHCGMGSPR